ncbi:MAG: TraR/DksA family transcriptional regulator [Sneathiella sp.]|nr:TraR/DksA family transcriptional regulator [Sneathiella sp.]
MLDLQKSKEELAARMESLEVRAKEMNETLRSEHSQNFSEQAHEREDDEVLERLEAEAKAEIIAIKAALSRIDEGNYGACSNCGEEIGEKRLQILPFTSQCIGCAR